VAEPIPADLIAIEWAFADDLATMGANGPHLTICRMVSPFYEGVRYAVRRGAACLSVGGKWAYEPIPSSRTDAFYKRFRFTTFERAVAAARKARAVANSEDGRCTSH
jgi:hypothetical protein